MTTLATPQKLWLDTTMGRVQVFDSGGEGTPIMLVHAFLIAGADLYAKMWPLLVSRGYRCLIPELPLGAHQAALKSDASINPATLAALLVEVLNALNIEQVHMVGVDTGGALTQIMMANHRERVDHVILTACDAYEAFPPGFLKAFLILRLPIVLNIFSQLMRWRPLRRLLVPRALTHAGVDDATLLGWTQPLLNPAIRRDVLKVLNTTKPNYTLAAAATNRDFPRPVLIAWGEDDRFFPRRLGQRLAQDLPQAQYLTLPDCAALAALDQPQLLARLIDDHIQDKPANL